MDDRKLESMTFKLSRKISYLLVESNCTKECAEVFAKEMVFAKNGVNPSTDLEVVRAHTHTYTQTHAHTE